MLVPAMTNAEVDVEIRRDYDKLQKITFNRVLSEYDRERKKLKVAKEKVYSRAYPIKTGTKNPWLLIIQKAPSVTRYRHESDAVGCGVVYFFSKEGLKVFRPQTTTQYMEVFYGHFFTRYNERMNLNLVNHVDMIKAFFDNSGYLQPETYMSDGKKLAVSVCREGIALGQYYADPEWLVHKTFITHHQKRPDQLMDEQRLMALAQLELINKSLEEENLNNPAFLNDNNALLHILGIDHPVFKTIKSLRA